MTSSLSGYVGIPRHSVIFDGTNYGEFIAFMRIHMRGLHLWGVMTGEVSCPMCHVFSMASTPPMPSVLAADATRVAKEAAKAVEDVAYDAYDQHV
jgi:hypothetical protein